ncbi:hypothetical protein JHK85_025495 [Glycine max]|nr:hypothetical protein JHK85_025495 [Glycine max]
MPEDGVICTFTFGGNGKRSESVNNDAMEAENHCGAAYGGWKSRQCHVWMSVIAAAALHGGSRQLMKPGWKRFLSHVGPDFLVSLAYLDPGNSNSLTL